MKDTKKSAVDIGNQPSRSGRPMASAQESPVRTWKSVKSDLPKVPKYSWPQGKRSCVA